MVMWEGWFRGGILGEVVVVIVVVRKVRFKK